MMQEISLTPLIDTALTLLIIFMVTAPMMNNAIKVELPKGQAKEDSGAQQELIVYVDKDENLFFNGTAAKDTQDLIAQVQAAVGKQNERTLFVKADQSVRYGQVIELVDDIKMVGGVAYVALATTPA
jgi:biopolymer transport protein ExbD